MIILKIYLKPKGECFLYLKLPKSLNMKNFNLKISKIIFFKVKYQLIFYNLRNIYY